MKYNRFFLIIFGLVVTCSPDLFSQTQQRINKILVSTDKRIPKKWVSYENKYRKLEKNPNLLEFNKEDRLWVHDFIYHVYNNDKHISAIETDYEIEDDCYYLYFCNIDHITWSFLRFVLEKYKITNIEFYPSLEIGFQLQKQYKNIKNSSKNKRIKYD